MNLKFSENGKVAVTMVEYLKCVISDFEEVEILSGTSYSPAAECIYTILKEINQIIIDDKRGTECHNSVDQLLVAYPRSRKDIQMAVYFLTTKVRDPDYDYLGNIKRLIRYVWRTIDMSLI